MPVIHRWQPTGLTPCGLRLEDVAYNEGQFFDDGVTCLRCLGAKQKISLGGQRHPRRGQQQLFEEDRHG